MLLRKFVWNTYGLNLYIGEYVVSVYPKMCRTWIKFYAMDEVIASALDLDEKKTLYK
jgi:hypothetical protein